MQGEDRRQARRCASYFPEAKDMWLGENAKVSRTGQSKRFVAFNESLNRWFDVFVFRMPTSDGRLAAIFSDVTDRKRTEAATLDRDERTPG